MIDDLLDELLYGMVPDRPAVVYLLPTVLLGAGLVAVADPFPTIAVGVGLLLSVALFVAYDTRDSSESRLAGSGRGPTGS